VCCNVVCQLARHSGALAARKADVRTQQPRRDRRKLLRRLLLRLLLLLLLRCGRSVAAAAGAACAACCWRGRRANAALVHADDVRCKARIVVAVVLVQQQPHDVKPVWLLFVVAHRARSVLRVVWCCWLVRSAACGVH
jgi:hypothetical protein